MKSQRCSLPQVCVSVCVCACAHPLHLTSLTCVCTTSVHICSSHIALSLSLSLPPPLSLSCTSPSCFPSQPTALFGSAWIGKSPNPGPYNKPPPGWASKEAASSKPTSSGPRVSAQVQKESASFWEEVMEGGGNDYDGGSGDAVHTHRNSAPTGPAPLSSRDKGEGPKKKAPSGGAEGKKLPPPIKEEVRECYCTIAPLYVYKS